jgi:hypothetical protein
MCACTEYRNGAKVKMGFLCTKTEGPTKICIPAVRSGSKNKNLPVQVQMLLQYCPVSDYSVCQNGLPPPAPPPAPPTSPAPPRPPPPPSPRPPPPGKPKPPPSPPTPPPKPSFPPFAPGVTVVACKNTDQLKKCVRKLAKGKCGRAKIKNKCKLTCKATCVR